MLLPNSHSFLLIRSANTKPVVQSDVREVVAESAIGSSPPSPDPGSSDSGQDPGNPTIRDKKKRAFLKAAGIAGASIVASLLLPKKADALILGSSPTTGVVGVKNASNARINPATEETVSTLATEATVSTLATQATVSTLATEATAATLLKTSDLTFDAGDLQVKVTSLPGGGTSAFSDSGDVAKSGLVDAQRHVQVDVLSSALPTSASTETTLQTLSFGGYKFSLRMATVGDIDYIGEAAIGTATSAASWRIKRVDNTTGVVIQWAGTGTFDQVWDNRASLTYS